MPTNDTQAGPNLSSVFLPKKAEAPFGASTLRQLLLLLAAGTKSSRSDLRLKLFDEQFVHLLTSYELRQVSPPVPWKEPSVRPCGLCVAGGAEHLYYEIRIPSPKSQCLFVNIQEILRVECK